LTYSKGFAGKKFIMTGATGGIGAKVAKRLLKAGKYRDIQTLFHFKC
jgi:NAD(P)-dependent dehydrogenase (short-subunit alcohol dehydrogenase family)